MTNEKAIKTGIIVTGILLISLGIFNIANLIKEHLRYNIFTAPYPIIINRIITMVFNLSLLIAGAGVITLKKWARVLGLILITMHAVSLLTKIRLMFNIQGFPFQYIPPVFISQIIQLLLCAAVIIYLSLSQTKQYLK